MIHYSKLSLYQVDVDPQSRVGEEVPERRLALNDMPAASAKTWVGQLRSSQTAEEQKMNLEGHRTVIGKEHGCWKCETLNDKELPWGAALTLEVVACSYQMPLRVVYVPSSTVQAQSPWSDSVCYSGRRRSHSRSVDAGCKMRCQIEFRDSVACTHAWKYFEVSSSTVCLF